MLYVIHIGVDLEHISTVLEAVLVPGHLQVRSKIKMIFVINNMINFSLILGIYFVKQSVLYLASLSVCLPLVFLLGSNQVAL